MIQNYIKQSASENTCDELSGLWDKPRKACEILINKQWKGYYNLDSRS
ncbi:MAG: hypothetical protein K9I84_16665 [Leadbetterella sp.]|nr:hypothetical protein [Leadbetterella sp.]